MDCIILFPILCYFPFRIIIFFTLDSGVNVTVLIIFATYTCNNVKGTISHHPFRFLTMFKVTRI